MVRKALQLFVIGLLSAVGVPLKAVPSVAVDPCCTYCEGGKVGFRALVQYNAVSVQACGSSRPGVSATWGIEKYECMRSVLPESRL